MKIDSTKYGTPTEVADAIGVARTTLITAINRGEIKHTRTIGGSMLIDVESAKAWAGVAVGDTPTSDYAWFLCVFCCAKTISDILPEISIVAIALPTIRRKITPCKRQPRATTTESLTQRVIKWKNNN